MTLDRESVSVRIGSKSRVSALVMYFTQDGVPYQRRHSELASGGELGGGVSTQYVSHEAFDVVLLRQSLVFLRWEAWRCG